MICEKLIGALDTLDVSGRRVEYVDIEWHEAFKKLHKKTTDKGTEVGIRMEDWVLSRGLYEGDVIYEDAELVIAVHTPPCEVIVISVEPGHGASAAKVCYEIGNRHAPLFLGDDAHSFITVYNEPMFHMLTKIHGVRAVKELRRLDFDRRISESVHNHHH